VSYIRSYTVVWESVGHHAVNVLVVTKDITIKSRILSFERIMCVKYFLFLLV
jgi:hypothetical protein